MELHDIVYSDGVPSLGRDIVFPVARYCASGKFAQYKTSDSNCLGASDYAKMGDFAN